MTLGETLGVGLGALALVAPFLWPRMPKRVSYPVAAVGFGFLFWSGLLALEGATNMKVHGGSLTAIVLGALIVAGGVASHIWLSSSSAQQTEKPAERAAQNAPMQEGSKMPSPAGKNNVVISGSNNTVSIGHIGDVSVPGPELRLSSAQGTQSPDGSFVAVFDAQIVAPYTPGSLRVEAWAPGITKLDVAPQRTGMAMFGHSGVRADHAFSTVMNPFGLYKIYVTTKEPTNVEIRYGFDQ